MSGKFTKKNARKGENTAWGRGLAWIDIFKSHKT
jgi:hypothetical protein